MIHQPFAVHYRIKEGLVIGQNKHVLSLTLNLSQDNLSQDKKIFSQHEEKEDMIKK